MSQIGAADIFERFADAYDRPARLYPALVALSPLAVSVVCIFGQDRLILSAVISIAASCGAAFLLSRIARDAGKRLQEGLFEKWGGAPTTQLLRHRNHHFDVHTKERYHRALGKNLGMAMPSVAEESADSLAADEKYRAASAWLINQTRDVKKFHLLFRENIAFGFHRNCLGLRPFASVLCVFCLFVATALIWIAKPVPQTFWVAAGYDLLLLLTWVFLLNEESLKRTGFSYAERLLQTIDTLQTSKLPKRSTLSKEI